MNNNSIQFLREKLELFTDFLTGFLEIESYDFFFRNSSRNSVYFPDEFLFWIWSLFNLLIAAYLNRLTILRGR